MKRIVSLLLCLCLVLPLWGGMPRAGAEALPEIPDTVDEYTAQACMELYEEYGCLPTAGGYVYLSELEEGRSYVFWEHTNLILDVDRTLGWVISMEDLTIQGEEEVLTAKGVHARGTLWFDGGNLVCPALADPMPTGSLMYNGLLGVQGVNILGGTVTCPEISGGGESVSIGSAVVNAGSISGIFGVTIDHSQVTADTIWGRDGVSIQAGETRADNIMGWRIELAGKVRVSRVESPSDPVDLSIPFPARIVEPQGGRWNGKQFTDAAGNPVDSVLIDLVQVQEPFADVPRDAFYSRAVAWAVWKQVTNGTDQTHFSPAQTCTRGQIVTFLWRAMGSPAPQGTETPFADVEPSRYYGKAVAWAVEQGIAKGMAPDRFAPEDPCTRGQIVTFLWRARGSPSLWELGLDVPEDDPMPLSMLPFDDVAPADYYAAPVLAAYCLGITNGVDYDHFAPQAPCTRGQVVTLLYRAENYLACPSTAPTAPTVPTAPTAPTVPTSP